MLKQIINDRDRKFLSEFWNAFFINFEINFFYSTTYHSQTDKQSEKINQLIKIALKHHFATLKNSIIWPKTLFVIQKNFNNFIRKNGRTSNEIVYEFISTKLANFLKSKSRLTSVTKTNIFTNWICQKISDAITFSQLIFKHYYNQKHKLVYFSKRS